MTRDQAKEILALYRPNIDDASEPDVAQALESVKADPELARWFEEHCALYSVTRQKFQAIAVPAELPGWILAGRRQRPQWWRAKVVWAAAAVLIGLLLVVLSQQSSPKNTFAAYRSRMVRTAMSNYGMPFMTNDLSAIRSYLATNHAHGDYVLPPALAKLPGQGCVILPWHERTVSLICLDGGASRDIFLFVINRNDLSDPPRSRELAKIGNLATASWSDVDKTYILATKGNEEFLKKLL
jgi:hypothetical protein